MAKQAKSSALESLRRRGQAADGFSEGYEARDAIVHVAQMIRQMRLDAGLTQAALAERAGMAQPDISRLEAGLGTQGPGVEILNRLAMACNLRLFMGMQDASITVQTGEVPTLKYVAEI